MKKLVLLLFCLWSLSIAPAYAFRCGSNLISEGDHKIEVLNKCGPPTAIDQRIEYRLILPYPYYYQHPYPYPTDHSGYLPIYIEEWIYNLGPHRFMQLLEFENGVVRKIRNLDKGS